MGRDLEGLYRHDLDTGRFERLRGARRSASTSSALIQSGDGRIFFAASDGRLWVLDPAAADRRARPLNDGAFAALTHITALARGRGIRDLGRRARRPVQGRSHAARNRAHSSRKRCDGLGTVSVMATDAQGDVWIGRSDGDLLRYRPADGGLDRFPQAPRNTLAILPGKGGEIWIGARGGGLSRLDPKTGRLIVYRHDPENAASLSSDDVAAIYEDAIGSLWIGSWNGGVNRFDPHAQAFRTFRHRARIADSLPADDVTAMTETPDGRLWLASRSGIVGAGDPRTGRFRTAAMLRRQGTADGARVVGRTPARRHVARADRPRDAVGPRGAARPGAAGASSWRSADRRDSRAPGRRVDCCREGAVSRRPRDAARAAVRVERFEMPIAGSVSDALDGRAAGRLWIGSDRGEVVRAEWSGPDAAVAMLPLDVGGPIGPALARGARRRVGAARGSAGTSLGRDAARPRTNRAGVRQVSWLGQHEGLPSTNIAGIVGDADGHLWLAHNRGLTRMDPASGAMTHFGERDGAQGKGYAEGAWAAGGSGLIYFAGEGRHRLRSARGRRQRTQAGRSSSPRSKSSIAWWRRDGWTRVRRSSARSTRRAR